LPTTIRTQARGLYSLVNVHQVCRFLRQQRGYSGIIVKPLNHTRYCDGLLNSLAEQLERYQSSLSETPTPAMMLALTRETGNTAEPVNDDGARLLELADCLAELQLDHDTRLDLVAQLRRALGPAAQV
jgi:hypothetical protein